MSADAGVQPPAGGYGALIKVARSLDQTSPESMNETLAKIWSILVNSIAGPFHAPEQSILRWLLKNMNGPAETAEVYRRSAMVWRIMGCVFTRMPLFSLAKSLADRRFIQVLQQTLKDVSKPQNVMPSKPADGSSDVEVAEAGSHSSSPGPQKRKRASTIAAESGIEDMRSTGGRVNTAEQLFEALRLLLARVDSDKEDLLSNTRMGAEHVKSLFFSSAKETVELLRMMLTICDLALAEQESESRENQSSWIATFAGLWDLHLRGSSDALDVSQSLYPTGCIILAKLERSRDLVIDPHIKLKWMRDLRRFFIKSMILPARAAFLNHNDIAMFKGAVEATSVIPTVSCPVIFGLALRAPHPTDDASARKDYEDWTQTVFETVEESLRDAELARRNQAMKLILDMALEYKARLSLATLRLVCRKYTADSEKAGLDLVFRIAKLDIDVFLISDEGRSLLDDILQQITNLADAEAVPLQEGQLQDFIVSLAKGFARGRDLSGFLSIWLQALAGRFPGQEQDNLALGIWSGEAVAETVASLVQPSMTTKQLVASLDWVDAQVKSTTPEALLVVLWTISRGITEEEFVGAINTRLFEIISKLKLRSLNNEAKTLWWHVVENTVSWSTLEQSKEIWNQVESGLKKTLKKSDLSDSATVAAFHCAYRLWLANYPGGPQESEASALVHTFLERLIEVKHESSAMELLRYLEHAPRLVDLAMKRRDATVHFLQPLVNYLAVQKDEASAAETLMLYEANLHNRKYLNDLIERAINLFNDGVGSMASICSLRGIAHFLLQIPLEAFSREQRERIMKAALRIRYDPKGPEASKQMMLTMKSLLSLMIKIMGNYTFPEDMTFADLVSQGESLLACTSVSLAGYGSTDYGLATAYETLKLFESLATTVLKQTTTTLDSPIQRTYLEKATSTALGWSTQVGLSQIHLHILLRCLAVALESSSGRLPPAVDSVPVREHLSLVVANCLTKEFVDQICRDPDHWLKQGLSTSFALDALEMLDFVDPAIVRERITPLRMDIANLSKVLRSRGLRAGWRLEALLFQCFGDKAQEPLSFTVDSVVPWPRDDSYSGSLPFLADIDDVNSYIEVVVGTMDQEARNKCLKTLAQGLRGNQQPIGSLLSIHYLVRADSESTSSSPTGTEFDLATLHSVLVSQLPSSKSPGEFSLTAQIIHELLDRRAGFMNQWNTEVTLSSVALMCAKGRLADGVSSSPKSYEWLCRLVEVIIKRHRFRLDGHFHLLVTVLQALLRRLLAVPSPTSEQQQNPSSPPPPSHRERHAKQYARLLTLVCEPSAASVAHGQPHRLDSATDAAKRYAGQHMLWVLVLYVKLQLEDDVPRVVREALQPGVYSILDITPQGGRRIMSEAMDGSGRAIFRELWRQYLKFGKWTGV